MFYIQSIDRYNAYCRTLQDRRRLGEDTSLPKDYYCQLREFSSRVNTFVGYKIKWGKSPTALDREDLVIALQHINCSENIEITTGHF